MGEKGQVIICFSRGDIFNGYKALSEIRTFGAALMKPNNEWCWLVRRQHSTLTKKQKHETHGTIGISMEWKSTPNSQGNKPSRLSGNPSVSPLVQLEGSKHQVAHHLWQLLEPPEGNFFWRCVLQPTSLERFSAALESCWFLWNGWFLWETCIIFFLQSKENTTTNQSDRSVHHLSHEELVTDSCNSCGSTGPGSMWDACCYFQNMLKYGMFSIPNFVIKVTHLSFPFPNQRISHSLPPQIARIHKLNAPIFLQKFGHCRLENPRTLPEKGTKRACAHLPWFDEVHPKQPPAVTQTVVILLMFSCLAHRFRKRIVLSVWLLRRVGWCVGVSLYLSICMHMSMNVYILHIIGWLWWRTDTVCATNIFIIHIVCNTRLCRYVGTGMAQADWQCRGTLQTKCWRRRHWSRISLRRAKHLIIFLSHRASESPAEELSEVITTS